MKLLFSLLITGLTSLSFSAQTPPPTPDQAAVVQGNNAFATDLYAQLRTRGGNLFFSPESISTALAISYAGARGDTASEMATALHFTLPPAQLHPAMGALLSSLNAPHETYQLHVANALWAQKGYAFREAFLKLTSADYGASFNQVDFETATEAARSTINQWVAQKTEDKIKDLLPPGVLDFRTRMVLTDAIYFKGDWQTQFDRAQTKAEDFHVTPGQNSLAPLMHRQGDFNYLDGRTFQVLEIPYKSRELSMIVFLPNAVGGLPALEKLLTAATAQQWLSQLRPTAKIILTLPRFEMTEQFELKDALSAMGMPHAFEKDEADFSGISSETRRRLFISAVIHKAYVDVNEEGTEAAAATAVITARPTVAMRPRPPIVFRADHPFIFLIRDNRSGGILFMGRVTDPTK
jgi:serpin B